MSKEINQKPLNFFILGLAIVSLDQLSKYLAQQSGQGMVNEGGVFGVFPSLLWTFFLPVLLLWLGVEWWREKNGWAWWGMGLLWSAGVSNWLDRVIYGGVYDFIHYPRWGFYGNIADIVLGIGVLVLFGGMVLRFVYGRKY